MTTIPESDRPDQPPPLRVPGDTTPTWELEMLVSGAVIFGLFQLPPLLNDSFNTLLPRFTGGAEQLLFLGLTLAEATVFALTIAFVVHLVSRTYWVALVGLDSVYPGGVRWERLRRGPIFTEMIRARERPLSERISAVDNFCSVIFAFAFLAATMVAFGAVMLAVATLLSLLISRELLGGRTLTQLPVILVFLFGFTMTTLNRLDRRFGPRLAPDDWRARVLRALLAGMYRASGRGLFGPILNTLASNVRRRVMVGSLVTLLFLSLSAVALQRNMSEGGDLPRSLSYVPEGAGQETMDFREYADQRRGTGARAAVPFIQSDMIRDPYVRLFIPYLPDRDDAVLGSCPDATPSGGADTGSPDSRAAGVIRCLAALHAVAVDGRPMPELDFRFYTDPVSGLVGILTYIPVEGLPRGRNVLTVTPSPLPVDEAAGSAAPPLITIPFWL